MPAAELSSSINLLLPPLLLLLVQLFHVLVLPLLLLLLLLRCPPCQKLCAADPFAIQQLCLRWLHSFLHPQPMTVTFHLPTACSEKTAPTANASTEPSNKPEAPQVSDLPDAMQPTSDQNDSSTTQIKELSLAPQTIVCKVVSEVMQLSSLITHPTRCRHCHQPVTQTSLGSEGPFHSPDASRRKESPQAFSTLQVSQVNHFIRSDQNAALLAVDVLKLHMLLVLEP